MASSETTGRRGAARGAVATVFLSLAVVFGGASCTSTSTDVDEWTKPTAHDLLKKTYRVENFTDAILAKEWKVTHGSAKVRDGRLVLRAREIKDEDKDTSPPIMPFGIVWLDKPLPHEFKASWKAMPAHAPNDVNAFFGGDGAVPSGMEIVLGGMGNTQHFLGRWDVPDSIRDRKRVDSYKQVSLREGATYEVSVERTAQGTRVSLGGLLIMKENEEPEHLKDDFRFFGFSTWDNEVEIWDLTIEPILRGPLATKP